MYFSRSVSGEKAGALAGWCRQCTVCENAYPGEGFARSCEVTNGRRQLVLLVLSLEVTKRQISTLSPNGRFITCRNLTWNASPWQLGRSLSPTCEVYSGSAW